MVEHTRRSVENRLDPVAPDERLVVLARTLQAQDPGQGETSEDRAADRTSLGNTCLGRALYRHRSVFRSGLDAPVWSHLELSYFSDIVPVDAVRRLVFARKPASAHLLRAEILLATPSAFVVPRGWRGSADRPERQASLEYIHVEPARLGEYRDIMRRYIGPAAARLVAMDRIGTFRAMETAAVLYQDASLNTDWNQIHLSEVEADGFEGFGQLFDSALREIAPDGGFAGVFDALAPVRTIPRWTFNDTALETGFAIEGSAQTGLPIG